MANIQVKRDSETTVIRLTDDDGLPLSVMFQTDPKLSCLIAALKVLIEEAERRLTAGRG